MSREERTEVEEEEILKRLPRVTKIEKGIVRTFKIRNEDITITLPKRLGGKKLKTSVKGITKFKFTSTKNPDVFSLQVLDIEEFVSSLILPFKGRKPVETGEFLLSPELINPKTSRGSYNSKTGEYNLEIDAVLPNVVALVKGGIKEPGRMIAKEQGKIDPETGHLEATGTITIESGFLEGTQIHMSPKDGDEITPVYGIVSFRLRHIPRVCESSGRPHFYAIYFDPDSTLGKKVIASSGVYTQSYDWLYHIRRERWVHLFTWTNFWNGSRVGGEWRGLMNVPTSPCDNMIDSYVLDVMYRE